MAKELLSNCIVICQPRNDSNIRFPHSFWWRIKRSTSHFVVGSTEQRTAAMNRYTFLVSTAKRAGRLKNNFKNNLESLSEEGHDVTFIEGAINYLLKHNALTFVEQLEHSPWVNAKNPKIMYEISHMCFSIGSCSSLKRRGATRISRNSRWVNALNN